MKKLSALLIVAIAALTLTGCNIATQNSSDNETKSSTQKSSNSGETTEPFQAVLDSKKTFISRDGGELYLKDYTRYDGRDGSRSIEYTYVDFNGDENQEIVLMMSSDISGGFLVLYSNGDKVYGYDFHWEGMLDLKQDGSFMQCKGDEDHYCKLKIENNKFIVIDEAIKFYQSRYEENSFVLDGKTVSEDEFNKFADNWQKKKNVVWQKTK